jgi:hypothetical protein
VNNLFVLILPVANGCCYCFGAYKSLNARALYNHCLLRQVVMHKTQALPCGPLLVESFSLIRHGRFSFEILLTQKPQIAVKLMMSGN